MRSPEVEREKLLLSVQKAKLRGEEALRQGDRESARIAMNTAYETLASAPMAAASRAAEASWFAPSIELLSERDDAYNRKRMSASRAKMARGTRDRGAGGEVDDQG